MKKAQLIASLFALGILTTTALQAQVAVGLRGGVNFGSVDQTDLLNELTPEFESITGLTAGIYAELPLGRQLAFRPELAFTQKGFGLSQEVGVDLFEVPLPVGVRAQSVFDYLELPLLMKVSFGEQAIKAYLTAGPSVGYALGGRLKTRSTGLLELDLINTSINLDAVNYERFELAGIVGGGLSFETGPGTIILEGRYQHGFTELYDIPLVSERIRNRGYAINVGYNIPLN